MKRVLAFDFGASSGRAILGSFDGDISFLSETNLDVIAEMLKRENPKVVIIDSIQTMYRDEVASAPGSVSQVRESTSVLMQLAKGLGISVIGLTGKTGGKLRDIADVCICAPETETYKVQELHLPVYHNLCLMLEDHFFGE